MISVRDELLRIMRDSRPFIYSAEITFTDDRSVTLTQDDLCGNGNRILLSSGGSSFPVGCALSKCLTLNFYNLNDRFSDYDFFGAVIHAVAKAELSETTETIDLGSYTVTEPETYGTMITLSAYDNMYKADRKYTPGVTFPTTAQDVYIDACTQCGLVPITSTFYNYNYVVQKAPENASCRQVFGMLAMLAGGNAIVDGLNLKIISYSVDAMDSAQGYDGGIFDGDTPYSTGAIIDGGSFNPWNGGDDINGGRFADFRNIQILSPVLTCIVSTDDVIITGITIKNGDNQKTYGNAGYILELSNELTIGDETRAKDIIGPLLVGLRFRPFTLETIAYPLAEFGDICYVPNGMNTYVSFITDIDFTFAGKTVLKCAADSPIRNLSKHYVQLPTSAKQLRELIQQEASARSTAYNSLVDQITNSPGLYQTAERQADGSYIYYFHDKPTKNASSVIWKMTKNAMGVSTDGGESWNFGATADGNLIANILSTDGIDGNWIRANTLSASKITTGTMLANRIAGGTLKLGGQDGANGLLEIYNNSNVLTGKFDQIGVRVFNNGYLASFASEEQFENFDGRICMLTGGDVIVGEYYDATDYNPSSWQMMAKLSTVEVADDFASTWPIAHLGSIGSATFGAHALTFGEWVGTNRKTPNIYMAIQNNSMITNGDDTDIEGYYWSPVFVNKRATFIGDIYVNGTIHSKQSKPRTVNTRNYAARLLYCYETPSPCFGDIGTGKTDSNGECYVFLDDILKETINMEHEYVVFLQKEGAGDIWVEKRETEYFVVKGTPNLDFSWELKAKQFDATSTRFEELKPQEEYAETEVDDGYTDVDYASEGAQLVEDYMKIMEGTA